MIRDSGLLVFGPPCMCPKLDDNARKKYYCSYRFVEQCTQLCGWSTR